MGHYHNWHSKTGNSYLTGQEFPQDDRDLTFDRRFFWYISPSGKRLRKMEPGGPNNVYENRFINGRPFSSDRVNGLEWMGGHFATIITNTQGKADDRIAFLRRATATSLYNIKTIEGAFDDELRQLTWMRGRGLFVLRRVTGGGVDQVIHIDTDGNQLDSFDLPVGDQHGGISNDRKFLYITREDRNLVDVYTTTGTKKYSLRTGIGTGGTPAGLTICFYGFYHLIQDNVAFPV